MSTLFNFSASPILRLLSGRKKKPEEPTVDPNIVNSLASLVGGADWQRYKQLLDIYVSANVKYILSASDDAEVHRLRGYIQGLLHAAQIPEQIVQEDEHRQLREQRTESAAGRRANAARGSLFSTGYFD